MDKKERKYRIRKIFNLCLEIQESGRGENGHPLVQLEIGNYGSPVIVWVMDNGWSDEGGYDGQHYPLDSDDKYAACVSHLKKLLLKIKEGKPCTEE